MLNIVFIIYHKHILLNISNYYKPFPGHYIARSKYSTREIKAVQDQIRSDHKIMPGRTDGPGYRKYNMIFSRYQLQTMEVRALSFQKISEKVGHPAITVTSAKTVDVTQK